MTNRLALLTILALYVGVVWVESQSLTMWGRTTTPQVRQPGAENLRPETQDKPGLTKPEIGAGSGAPLVSRKAGTVQDRAWVEGCKGRCVKLASQRTPDEFPFYLRPVAAGEPALGMDAQWGVPVGIRAESTQTLLPPSAARENTTMPRELSGFTADGCGHCARASIIDVGAGDGWTDSGGPMASRPAPIISDRSGYDAMGNITDRADSVVGTPSGTPRGGHGQSRPGVTGKATYYHPSLAGNVMRDGVTVYQPYLRGAAAATSWPIGTRLTLVVTRSIQVVISDTGHLGPGHVDLSEADFAELAPLSKGVIEVSMREVE